MLANMLVAAGLAVGAVGLGLVVAVWGGLLVHGLAALWRRWS